ncbi:MAG: CpXC domain-containing protein [Spirochaetaceae bacterium]|jgi:hypothetical protein|nr:CpXC domain-containing protein [Spirochaetaceae bacterium]
MKRKIACICETAFDIDVPESVDLDETPDALNEVMDGTFLSYTCPGCGKIHKPEFPVTIVWPSKSLILEVLPETERGAYYRRKKDGPGSSAVISFPEMAERLAVIRDGLEPVVIEALKYYMLSKAQQNYPDREISMWYQKKEGDLLEFHLHGIREGEVAVSRIPWALYEKNFQDYKKNPRSELFSSLRIRSYISVQNLMRPEELM